MRAQTLDATISPNTLDSYPTIIFTFNAINSNGNVLTVWFLDERQHLIRQMYRIFLLQHNTHAPRFGIISQRLLIYLIFVFQKLNSWLFMAFERASTWSIIVLWNVHDVRDIKFNDAHASRPNRFSSLRFFVPSFVVAFIIYYLSHHSDFTLDWRKIHSEQMAKE